VGKAYQNTLLKERENRSEDVEEEVSSYWTTLSKREDTVNLKRKH